MRTRSLAGAAFPGAVGSLASASPSSAHRLSALPGAGTSTEGAGVLGTSAGTRASYSVMATPGPGVADRDRLALALVRRPSWREHTLRTGTLPGSSGRAFMPAPDVAAAMAAWDAASAAAGYGQFGPLGLTPQQHQLLLQSGALDSSQQGALVPGDMWGGPPGSSRRPSLIQYLPLHMSPDAGGQSALALPSPARNEFLSTATAISEASEQMTSSSSEQQEQQQAGAAEDLCTSGATPTPGPLRAAERVDSSGSIQPVIGTPSAHQPEESGDDLSDGLPFLLEDVGEGPGLQPPLASGTTRGQCPQLLSDGSVAPEGRNTSTQLPHQELHSLGM
jgi:hypothetical protein